MQWDEVLLNHHAMRGLLPSAVCHAADCNLLTLHQEHTTCRPLGDE